MENATFLGFQGVRPAFQPRFCAIKEFPSFHFLERFLNFLRSPASARLDEMTRRRRQVYQKVQDQRSRVLEA